MPEAPTACLLHPSFVHRQTLGHGSVRRQLTRRLCMTPIAARVQVSCCMHVRTEASTALTVQRAALLSARALQDQRERLDRHPSWLRTGLIWHAMVHCAYATSCPRSSTFYTNTHRPAQSMVKANVSVHTLCLLLNTNDPSTAATLLKRIVFLKSLYHALNSATGALHPLR